jgi:hypothetical protein
VEQIESHDGARSFQFDNRRNARTNNNGGYQNNTGNRYSSPSLNMDEFDKELAEYKTEINEFE